MTQTGQSPGAKERREGSASRGGQDRCRAVYEEMVGARRKTRLSPEGGTVPRHSHSDTVQMAASGPVRLSE